jgi:hypothetical protein
MNVGELRKAIENVPDETRVVFEGRHESIPPDRLGEDEYDWYGGLPDGTFPPAWKASVRGGQLVIE